MKSEKLAIDERLAKLQRADKEKQLAVLRLRRDSLSTVEEKRNRADAQIEQLEIEIGLAQPKNGRKKG